MTLDSFLWWFIAMLAVYRLSHMIAMEEGPGAVFHLLREKFGQGNWFGRGLNCVLCISFWLSLSVPSFIMASNPVNPREFVILWVGTSGAVLTLHRLTSK